LRLAKSSTRFSKSLEVRNFIDVSYKNATFK